MADSLSKRPQQLHLTQAKIKTWAPHARGMFSPPSAWAISAAPLGLTGAGSWKQRKYSDPRALLWNLGDVPTARQVASLLQVCRCP